MRTFTQKVAFALIALLCFAMPQAVMAQDCLVIGEGTAHSSWYLPVANYYHNCYSQQLFLADELEMGAAQITSVSFQYDNATEAMTRTISVYMANTDAENLSTAFVTDGLQEVLSATLFTFDPNDDWSTIELTTPFAYDGTSNLVVAVYMNYSSAETSYSGGYRFAQTAMTGMARYASNDTSSPDQIALVNFAPTATGTSVSYRCNTQFCYTTSGGGPTCDKPETVEANDVTANSATINWLGEASAYNLQYKGATDEDWTLVKNLSGNTYQLTGLVSNTAYQVQVQSICGENTSGWKSVSFSTLIGLPYAEHFNGTSAPSGWTVWSGQLQADGSATRTSSSVWSFGSNNGVFDNHARSNIYGTGCYRWLQTPAIPIPAMEEGDPGFQMYFSLALTKFSGTLVEVVKGSQSDDRFVVLVSIDEGANWTILREWNNTGSEYVYDDIATAGEEVDPIDLSAYAGQTIILAFYGQSTVSGGDNNIHVDDVIVEEIPTCLKPTDLHAVDGAATSTTLPVAWTANSGEEAWRLRYKPTADAEAEWITLDIASNPYTITGLAAFTEYEIQVAAVCTEEDFTDFGKSIIAKTAAVVPFFQDFVTTALPGEWKRYEVFLEDFNENDAPLAATKNGWNVGAKNGVFGANHLYLNIKDSTDYWLVSPVIEMQAGYQLTFDLALTTYTGSTPTAVTPGQQGDDKFIVFVTTDAGVNWTTLNAWDNASGTSFDGISTEGQTVKFDLSAYAGQSIMLAFYGESTVSGGDNTIHISNLAIDLIPACERPLSITMGNITGTTAEVSWDADEEGNWEYGYVANPAADFVPAETDYTGTATDMIANLSGLSETTDYIFFVRRACSETEKSEPLTKTFKTLQTPAELPYVGDFEESNGWLTFNGEFVNKWVRGTAVANGGTHSLYISNDNGVSAAYTNNVACVVYATKTFYFEEAGMYSFSFDWMCNGEGNFDYIRVALVPASVEVEATSTLPTGLGTTSLPEGWIALDGGSKLNLSSTWQTQRVELNIEQLGYYKVVIVWRDDTSSGSDPAGAIDNFNISRLACRMPTGLNVSDITANSAAFAWNDDEDGMTWVYACVPAGQEPTEYTAVTENSLLLEGLTESTLYDFYLRKHCGENEESEPVMISFQTKQMPAEVGVLFSDDFEDGNHWLFNNGTLENAWAYGTAAHNGEGTHALYISNDGGTTNAYTLNKTTVVFATKLFHFQKGAYTFQYDWRGVGEGTSTLWDYLRVALVPADAEFTAGTTLPSDVTATALPSGCFALDGGKGLNQQSEWQTFTTDAINVEDGNYMVVLMWRNDSGSGSQTPAAVDNFSISRIVCATPAGFALTETPATTTSVELTWTPMSEETNWMVRYKEQGAEEWIVVPAANDTFLLEGLNPSTVYEAQVATQCDPEDATAIGTYSASIQFATECVPFASVDEDFEGSLICWSAVQDGNGYPLVLSNYPEDAHSGSKFLYFASQVGYEPADEYLVLPELISLENMRLKFYACNDVEEATENATLVVGVMSAPADTANFVALDTIVLTTATYNQYVVPFTAYTGDGKYVAIKMLAAETALASARIEDVVVEAIPSCMEPNALVVDSLTDNIAVLSWTPQGDEANWLVRYRKAGAEEWSEPILSTEATLLISGLEMGTAYEAQVAAWCDPTNAEAVSPYGAIISFTTLCGNITTLPWHADFENMAVNSIPTCWDNSASASTTLNSNPERIWGVYEYGGNKMLRMYNYFVSSGTALINMPTIVLPETPAYELSFDYAHTATCGEMTVKISVNGGDFEALTPTYGKTSTGTDKDNPGEFSTADINLTPYAGDTIVIQFFANANYGSGAIFLDNVDIHLAPTCLKPINVTALAATSNSLQIDWEPQGEEANWFVQYKKQSEENWMLVAEDVNAHPFTINGLEAATAYDIRVAAWCNPADSADASDYSNAVSALTECESLNVFPYSQNFDGYTGLTSGNILPICWDYINTCTYSSYSYYPTSYKSTTYAKSGENSLRFYSYVPTYTTTTDYDPQDQYAILPEMDDVNTLRLKFYARAYSTSYDADFYVGVMSDPSDTTTFEALDYIELESTTYEAFDIKLNGYHGNGKYIAIKMPAATYSYRGFHMDDITVEKLPACMEPEDVVASNFTATSATISWTNGAEGQTAWQIVYSADPQFDILNVTDEEIIDIASNPYELTGLLPDTLYNVYVRANCGETDGTSLWATTSFRTAKSCQTPDALAAANITHNSAAISWNTYGQTGFNLRYSTDGENWTVANGVESPYVINDLAASTTYHVQVQAACEGEEAWAGSFTFKTAYAAPFYEAFDATSIPADWSLKNGLLNDILSGAATLATNTDIWMFGTSNLFTDNHARINNYGTSRKHWLITPNVYTPANNQLTFDLALTVYSSSSQAAPTAGNQADDKFAVVISTDAGATWSVLREWNNAGSEYVYDNISNTGEEVAIDLAAYAGQAIMIGFYAESTVSNGDNNLHIDNVRIDAVPTCIKPTGLTISDVFAHSATLAWESDAAAWQIALDTIAAFNPDTLSNIIDVTENPYTLTDLLPSHNYYVYVRANCGETDGTSIWTVRQSFRTTIACPAPTGLEAQLTPGNGTIATLTWNAGEAQAWQVEYSLNSNMTDSLVLVVTEPVANLTGLTAEATYYARVKADCGELDGQSAYSAIISFLPTDIYSIVVNDGTNTNGYVPINGGNVDYGTVASQFIVPAESLQEILWDSITELTFYASQATVDWGAAEFEVYMTTTEDATLAALNDWDNLTQVMVAGNLSIANNKMVVTLSEPFQYTGDNLLIGFKQTAAGSWVSCSWYGKNTTGASIGGYGTGNNMTQRNFLPKMTINYVPGQAPACMWATHLAVSEITAQGATIAWDEVEGANWEYALVLAESNETPTEFSAATNPLVLDNLFENTAYVFYLRNNCGEENSKLVSKAFATIENIATIPYETQFADAASWKLANSDNAWTFGDNLFISNDGVNYGYDEDAASVSYATKLFDFDAAGDYTFTYYWKAVGEYNEEDGAIDFLRVALVPAEVQLTAGVAPEGLTAENLPAGWMALDGGAALVATNVFTRQDAIVSVPAGHYRVAFIWINDDSFTDGEPAAINYLYIQPGDATGIESGAGIENSAIKFIHNDQVYILLNGTVYTITGQKVEMK